MRDARAGYQGSVAEKKFVDLVKFDESVRVFFRERLEFYLKDVLGYAYDVIKAVLAAEADDVVDALARAEAVKQVMHMPEFLAIGAACKRMRNILRQAEEKGIAPAGKFEYLAEAGEEERPSWLIWTVRLRKSSRTGAGRNTWMRCCCFRLHVSRWTSFSTK
jgi:glycyl-tRNA synthetase beta subunit